MENSSFFEYRDAIISSLNKHGVEYKLVGGAVVQLINKDRVTSDLDLLLGQTKKNLEKVINALTDCGFASMEELRYQVFGDDENEEEVYTSFELIPSNLNWRFFHIDMCFDLGGFDIESLPMEYHYTEGGLSICSVPFRSIANMKAKVYPEPREQDLKDIRTIADYLGLDPYTGETPVEGKWWKWW